MGKAGTTTLAVEVICFLKINYVGVSVVSAECKNGGFFNQTGIFQLRKKQLIRTYLFQNLTQSLQGANYIYAQVNQRIKVDGTLGQPVGLWALFSPLGCVS